MPVGLLPIMWIVGWTLCHTAAMTTAKFLDPDVSTLTLVFVRNACGLAIVLAGLMTSSTPIRKQLVVGHPRLQVLRGVLLFGAFFCTYFTYRHLPMGTATAIGFSSPLFVSVLAIVLLKERVPRQRWIGILAGYLGVVVIYQPDYGMNLGYLSALLANLFAAINLVIIRHTSKDDQPLAMLFFAYSVVLVITSSVLVLQFFGTAPMRLALGVWQTPKPMDAGLLAAAALFGTASQYCYIKALTYKEASFVAPFEYLRMLYAVPLGLLIFGEEPTAATFAGCFLVIAGTWYSGRQRRTE